MSEEVHIKSSHESSWRRPLFSHSEAGGAVKGNVGLQVMAFLVASMVLDGGVLLRVVMGASVGYWLLSVWILFRRGRVPTPGDLIVLRLGFLMLLPVSIMLAPVWGWLIHFIL